MICPKCGAEIEDGLRICPACGVDFCSTNPADGMFTSEMVEKEKTMICPRCGAEIGDGLPACPVCGANFVSSNPADAVALTQAAGGDDPDSGPGPDQYKMRKRKTLYPYDFDDDDAPEDEAPYIEPLMSQSEFYKKTWFIILCLVLFWPLGVVMMWIYASWPKAVKIIVSVICAFILITYFI